MAWATRSQSQSGSSPGQHNPCLASYPRQESSLDFPHVIFGSSQAECFCDQLVSGHPSSWNLTTAFAPLQNPGEIGLLDRSSSGYYAMAKVHCSSKKFSEKHIFVPLLRKAPATHVPPAADINLVQRLGPFYHFQSSRRALKPLASWQGTKGLLASPKYVQASSFNFSPDNSLN